MSSQISIERFSVEHYPLTTSNTVLGITHWKPRLSWRFGGDISGWTQRAYSLHISWPSGRQEIHDVVTDNNVLAPWPTKAIQPKQAVSVVVEVTGSDGNKYKSQQLILEGGLPDDSSSWEADVISCPAEVTEIGKPKQPFRLRKSFTIPPTGNFSARLYITALGIYEAHINGRRVGDQLLSPGWQSYKHRLHYQTFDVSELLTKGTEMEFTAWVGEGWYAGELGWERKRCYGERIGLLARLEIDGQVVLKTGPNEGWEWSFGNLTSSEIYNGEMWDFVGAGGNSDWMKNTEILPFPKAKLISPETPPVRQVLEVSVKDVINTPSGETVLDFGQNLVGWVRIRSLPSSGGKLVLSHAEVLENGKLGRRPLRTARAQDSIYYGPEQAGQGWEPKFTFHGFRYVQVDGWSRQMSEAEAKENFTAVVIQTQMEETGGFECSHPLINQLHQNVVWSWRGNTVSIPSDCPQRDERLGWTGDLQVFSATASFLTDTSGFLRNWLEDFAEEQLKDNDGNAPLVVPDVIQDTLFAGMRTAVWSDIAVLLPNDLYNAYADIAIVAAQWESIVGWLERGVKRDDVGLWDPAFFQLGDWLDPSAPPDNAAAGKTDSILVADAYLIHITRIASKLAETIGKVKEGDRYKQQYRVLKEFFVKRYVTYDGRLSSDSQTAYALALKFGLLETPRQIEGALKRLEWLARLNKFKVGTGFAGTPVILDAFAENNAIAYAYRMLEEKANPSWLYPVSMGATTIWERWDSMLPDGSINPGEMTSFNHYALGAVAAFMHKYIGGLSLLAPGWKKILVAPRPGGTLTSAKIWHVSPYGRIVLEWAIVGSKLRVQVTIPPNCSAVVSLPGAEEGKEEEIGSGYREYEVEWKDDSAWPPQSIDFPQP
ncbi:alfa-L-rhamnosidase [Cryptococcus neoformans Ze90-1]|nr:alfa-L-rhamnosidase [Cryptococcus neoformans var. grubii Ze90-1]